MTAQWTTRNGETVTVGDRVAVYHLDYRDAIGEILGLFLGRIDFRVTQTAAGPTSVRMFLDEDQLLCHLPHDGGRFSERASPRVSEGGE